jgi:flagellar protein FliO/FliZ
LNCKLLIKVLLIVLFFTGGPANIYANTPKPSKECMTVAECYETEYQEQPGNDNQGEVQPETPKTNVSSIGTTIKVLFALVFVVVLLILVLKLLHKRTQVVQQGKGIQTLGGAMLGNQRSVQLVKVGHRILVVGVGDNVELIKEIEDQDEIDKLLLSNEGSISGTHLNQGIFGWLNTLKDNKKNSGQSDFRNILDQQLNDSKQKRNSILDSLKKGHDND